MALNLSKEGDSALKGTVDITVTKEQVRNKVKEMVIV